MAIRPRSAYWRTNLAGGARSQAQQIVEDQHLAVAGRPGPDADGRDIDASVTAAPTTSGTPSITKAKQPAASSALAASSRALAASTLLAWTRKPPMASTDWGVRPRWPMTGISARMMASITGSRARPPSSLTALGAGPDQRGRVAHGVFGR